MSEEFDLLAWQIKTIIEASNGISRSGDGDGWSTSEQIAAAFVLDRMELIPEGYSVIEAWERLGDWQGFVKKVKAEYSRFLI